MLSLKKKKAKVVQQSTVVVLHFYPEEPYFSGAVGFTATFCGLYGRSSQEWIVAAGLQHREGETKPNAL
jgi:hypothetical protein